MPALPDQFGNTHIIGLPTNRILILAIADRDGSPQLDGWTVPLADQFGSRVDIGGIAWLDGIAPIFRGMAVGIIKCQHPDMSRWLPADAGRIGWANLPVGYRFQNG